MLSCGNEDKSCCTSQVRSIEGLDVVDGTLYKWIQAGAALGGK